MLLSGLTLGWLGRFNSQWLLDSIFTSRDAHSVLRPAKTGEAQIDAIVDRIIKVESNGDPNLKNKRSSALGLGQFLDETGLNLIPDTPTPQNAVDPFGSLPGLWRSLYSGQKLQAPVGELWRGLI
jgi:hypothetical protein